MLLLVQARICKQDKTEREWQICRIELENLIHAVAIEVSKIE
jgi:hypothetical protein